MGKHAMAPGKMWIQLFAALHTAIMIGCCAWVRIVRAHVRRHDCTGAMQDGRFHLVFGC